MRIAYIQSIGGASGDMILAALLDLGVPLDVVKRGLAELGISGYELTAGPEARQEVRGVKLNVSVSNPVRYSPRSFVDVVSGSGLPDEVKISSTKVLEALWRAEGRVHGQSEHALELEELASVDTLVDVVGVAIGLDYLGVDKVYAAPLVLGAPEPPRWTGGYSNPAPAVLELVASAGAPVAADRPMHQGAGELTTPTGAAIITALSAFERPEMSVIGIGVGLGSKDPESFPNVTRIWLGVVAEEAVAPRQEGVVLLETNLDDVPGLVLGHAQERLFDLGALDVWYSPVQMKKNRPGVILSALVPQALENAAVELILRETPTLGVRTRVVQRYVAERRNVPMDTGMGMVNVKVKYLGGVAVGAAPEFEDCRRIALERGMPFQEVYQQAAAQARQQLLERPSD